MATLTVDSSPASFTMSGPPRTLTFALPSDCASATAAQWVAAGNASANISSAQIIVSYVGGPGMYLVPPSGSGAWTNTGQDLTPAQLAAVVALAGGTMSVTLVETAVSGPYSDAWSYLRLVVTYPGTPTPLERPLSVVPQANGIASPMLLARHIGIARALTAATASGQGIALAKHANALLRRLTAATVATGVPAPARHGSNRTRVLYRASSYAQSWPLAYHRPTILRALVAAMSGAAIVPIPRTMRGLEIRRHLAPATSTGDSGGAVP